MVTPTSYALKANRILVKKKAEVASDVYNNQLTNRGTIAGTEFTLLLLLLQAEPWSAVDHMSPIPLHIGPNRGQLPIGFSWTANCMGGANFSEKCKYIS